MRPILLEIPPIPVVGWILLLLAFFGLSAFWGARDVVADAKSDEERRRRVLGTWLTNAALFLVGAVLVWRFSEALARPLPVRAYGFMLMIAFAVGLYYLQRVARGSALKPDNVVDLILGLLLTTVIAARVLFILLHWGDYSADWRHLFRVWEGGLSFHGGLVGGIGWVAWYARRHGLRLLWLGDLMVPGLALGYALARVGCFLNGCCYGVPTHLPWAVRFQDPPLSGKWTDPSHPVQIYALLANLAIFGVLLRALPRKRYDGQLVGLYLILYCVYRFLAEALRKGVTGEVLALGMTQAQWASLGIIAVAVALMRWLRGRNEGVSADGAVAAAPGMSGTLGARPKAPDPAAGAKKAPAAAPRRASAKGKARKRRA